MFSPSRYLTALLLVFTFYLSAAQQTDKEIEALATEALKYERVPDSLSAIGSKILSIAKNTANEPGLIEGYLMLGHANYVKGDFKTSIRYYDSLLVYKEQWASKLYVKFYRAQRNKAIATIRSGKTDEGLVQFERLLQLTIENDDALGTAGTYNNIGISKKNEGNVAEAIDLYAKAIHIYDSLDAVTAMPSVLINIGIAQSLMGNNPKSLESFHEAVKIAKRHKVTRDEYRAYNNLAVSFLGADQADSAIFYLKKSIPRYKKNNIRREEYLAYQNLGAAFTLKKQSDSAYFYLNKSIIGFKELENPRGLAESYSRMADHYNEMEKYDVAIAYGDSSITKAKSIDNFVILKGNYSRLSSIYESKKDFEKANQYLKVSQEIEAKLFQLESSKQLNEILTKYQVDQKDDTIKALHKEKSIYQSTAFLISVIAAVLLIFFILLWLRNKNSKKELMALRAELASFNEAALQDKTPSLLHLKSKAVIDVKELLYVKSDGHYLEFYTEGSNKPEIDRNTLKDVIEKLSSEGFAQVHKSYLVNLAQIRIINSTKLMLEDGTWLPLSRTYKPHLKETLLHTTSNS